MSATIEEYLQGPQAVEDARALAPWAGRAGGRKGPLWLSCTRDLVWGKMGIGDDPTGLHWVYLRKEADRYIVSDLGDGLRAYALRTGDVEGRIALESPPSKGLLEESGRIFACSLRGDSILLTVSKDDLPGAIIRVMLASYRLANLRERDGAR